MHKPKNTTTEPTFGIRGQDTTALHIHSNEHVASTLCGSASGMIVMKYEDATCGKCRSAEFVRRSKQTRKA